MMMVRVSERASFHQHLITFCCGLQFSGIDQYLFVSHDEAFCVYGWVISTGSYIIDINGEFAI